VHYFYMVNWKLLLSLTPVGVLMGVLTLYFIPGRYEAVIGTPSFIFCAWFIGRYAPARHFLHGFLLGIVNSAIVTSIHVAFVGTYLAHHAFDAMQFEKMHRESGATPQQAMVLLGVVVALIAGVVQGLFSLIGRKTVRTLGGER
jgi:hypothetical protein